jgi:ABC-type glycerol-3-phosphate transport system substrate-binding protein
MSDDKEKSNVVDLSSRRPKPEEEEHDAEVEAVLMLSDDIDDVLNRYIAAGTPPDLVAAVVSNRLGTLLAAMEAAGISDPVDLYLDIVAQEAARKLDDED